MNRYPTRDNVYNLQRERQRRQAQAERQAREWQQAQMGYAQTPHPAKRKKHRQRRRGSHMMMPLLVFAIIALYLVGQIGSLAIKGSDIDVETVAYGTIDTPEVYTGLILREEYVVDSTRDGQPYYQYSQGDYVPKGAVVCTVKDTDSTDALESKLNQMVFVSATPGEYERRNSTRIAQQVIRPTGLLDPLISVRPVEGQVTDLLGEINARTAKNERVLVTTLTKKMAEDLTDFLTEQGIKVKYMHHEVDTFERMEIIKDLRLGSIDVVVGINLLREGLDLPEVSLVAILDADKEGFLRSETSLIQTIGRAARNAEGLVIMYADEVTDSMERAITETERRRAIQMAYNEEHGIVPKTIVKAIADSIEISDKAENAKRNTRRMGKLEREAAIERLTREMKEAAKLLEFEHAAFLRDQIDRLRRGENPTVDSDAETERRQNHAQTQRRGRKYLGKR